jgi:hypothetical protein
MTPVRNAVGLVDHEQPGLDAVLPKLQTEAIEPFAQR